MANLFVIKNRFEEKLDDLRNEREKPALSPDNEEPASISTDDSALFTESSGAKCWPVLRNHQPGIAVTQIYSVFFKR